MDYFRCKCGKTACWSSMGVRACDKCEHCGSNLASGPDGHADPLEHDFALGELVETDEGMKPLSRCRHCGNSRGEIAARQARMIKQVTDEDLS